MVVDPTTPPDMARFAFGKNWRDFASSLTPQQFASAKEAMVRLLGTHDLSGRSFLDVGSGSGLMSVVAHRLGARVTAFDYDPAAVATTAAVRDRDLSATAFPVLEGSILDKAFVGELGRFDVVYAWGVLHHTGDLWSACTNVADTVEPGGLLAVAIYNDQGGQSQRWRRIKRAYVRGGRVRQLALLSAVTAYFRTRHLLSELVATALVACLHPQQVLRILKTKTIQSRTLPVPRGMDRRHDLVDWVGGYPFEVATPERVFEFFHSRGFSLERLTTCGGGLGNNQFLFRRRDV
jgi:2-polyprenyl-3-methyl-5-hydroxy-6-metoxy-1,4-benzoquinol methylase